VRSRRSAALPAVVGAGAALLALSTLGLTWVRRSVEGPLGAAGVAEVEVLTGRDVAPLVAALVPGVTAVVVVGLLLTGRWRVAALALAAVGAAAAAVAAGAAGLGAADSASTVTATPLVAAAACGVVALSAGYAAVLTARRDAAVVEAPPGPVGSADGGTAGTVAEDQGAPRPEPPVRTAPDEASGSGGGSGSGSVQGSGDLWRALDEGRDPTSTADAPP